MRGGGPTLCSMCQNRMCWEFVRPEPRMQWRSVGDEAREACKGQTRKGIGYLVKKLDHYPGCGGESREKEVTNSVFQGAHCCIVEDGVLVSSTRRWWEVIRRNESSYESLRLQSQSRQETMKTCTVAVAEREIHLSRGKCHCGVKGKKGGQIENRKKRKTRRREELGKTTQKVRERRGQKRSVVFS